MFYCLFIERGCSTTSIKIISSFAELVLFRHKLYFQTQSDRILCTDNAPTVNIHELSCFSKADYRILVATELCMLAIEINNTKESFLP